MAASMWVQVHDEIRYQHHGEELKLPPGRFLAQGIGAGDAPMPVPIVTWLFDISELEDKRTHVLASAELVEQWERDGKITKEPN